MQQIQGFCKDVLYANSHFILHHIYITGEKKLQLISEYPEFDDTSTIQRSTVNIKP